MVFHIIEDRNNVSFLKEVLTIAKEQYPNEMGTILNFEPEIVLSFDQLPPLTRASKYGIVEMVKVLLSFEGINIAHRTRYGDFFL